MLAGAHIDPDDMVAGPVGLCGLNLNGVVLFTVHVQVRRKASDQLRLRDGLLRVTQTCAGLEQMDDEANSTDWRCESRYGTCAIYKVVISSRNKLI